jgi:hypothetical protein
MRTRHGLAVLGVAGALAVGGTATAVAGNGPGTGATAGTGKSNAPGQANRCERLDHAITVLDERVQTRLEARITRVEEKIASGDLTEKRAERAKKFLAHLQNRLEKLQALIDRLEAKFAEKCS